MFDKDLYDEDKDEDKQTSSVFFSPSLAKAIIGLKLFALDLMSMDHSHFGFSIQK